MALASSTLSLRALFGQALQSASKALTLPMLDTETQGLVMSSLRDLEMLAQGIDASGMFSSNESLEDLPTRHLPYLLVEFVTAEVEGRMGVVDRADRMQKLTDSQRHMRTFIDRLRQYQVIPEEERRLYSQNAVGMADFVKRREFKIKQFKLEKTLRGQLVAIRKRAGNVVSNENSSDDFDLIASLLRPPSTPNERPEADDDDNDEEMREVALLVVRLIWTQAESQLASMDQEMDLLRSAPPVDLEPRARQSDDTTWRLDPSIPRGGPDGKGPLLDSSGRPLRPFTILPGSTSSERSRMQAEVFRPDHRLPTMTMDEYLEEEKRRGNIISGGGAQSQQALTHSEQLTLDSEMDGTVESEAKAEEKRLEDERWAKYTDMHPKGEGNTMNRG